MPEQNNIINGMSVDYEEYWRAANLAPYIRNISVQSRIELSLHKTLDIFSEFKIKATFFVLGDDARDRPELIKLIADAGHELGSHSMHHTNIYELNQTEFLQQAKNSKELIEDLSGRRVLGFRAPNFSITKAVPWAYETLVEAGYLYDSSAYPVYHPRYSNPEHPRKVHKIKSLNGEITSVPLATFPFNFAGKKINLPLAGGAYWRLLPASLIKAGLRTINKNEGQAFFSYFHPWELDAGQPRLINGLSFTAWRHYGNVAKFPEILKNYFSTFKFDSYQAVLKKYYPEILNA